MISLHLQIHVACNMIYSLKNDQSWYEEWWEITEAWNKLFCTVERQGNTDTIIACYLHISPAPAFVSTSYICISTKLCLQNLFTARLSFAKSRSSGVLSSHIFRLVFYITSEILHFQIKQEQVPPSLNLSHPLKK